MPKEKIAIISILKPVDDTRSYEKFACTLSTSSNLEIHNYGFPTSRQFELPDNIYFHTHVIIPRGLIRFFTRLEVLIRLIKLKPKVIICNTHELLIVTVINKILFGCKILYDIQENYNFNLLYQGIYPFYVRRILACFIRLKERLLSPIFDHFILAEKSYVGELDFVKHKNTILENKAIIPTNWKKKKTSTLKKRILFSGTLTKSNGILSALSFMKKIHQDSQYFDFSIVGHCPESQIWKLINSPEYEFIELEISKKPIPHSKVTEQIGRSDYGMICYKLNPSNENCMPTKVYEYMALGLPILFESGGIWEEFILRHKAGILIDFDKTMASKLSTMLNIDENKTEHRSIKEAEWKTESDKLNDLIHNYLLSK